MGTRDQQCQRDQPLDECCWHVGNSLTCESDICDAGMWVIDPIDGTKGFLRGEQYAICLALIVDSVVQLGVLGCPNLPISPSNPSAGRGVIVLAVRGQGAAQASIERLSSDVVSATMDALFSPISIPSTPPKVDELRTLESVEAAHSAQGITAAITRALDLRTEPNRMDSQAKYAALARGMGEGHLYLRMPVPGKNYIEKIWVRVTHICTPLSSSPLAFLSPPHCPTKSKSERAIFRLPTFMSLSLITNFTYLSILIGSCGGKSHRHGSGRDRL